MKPREYCCCAIPVIYAGIYTTLTEQFVLGIVAGTLSVATPAIVGASTPGAAKWIFAIICYVGAALQLMGFAAVRNEKPVLFRRYTTLHLMVTIAAFSVAAVWIALSAARHTQAENTCKSVFYPNDTSISADESNVLCNIIPWVDVGIMGGLWVLLAIVQIYLYVVLSAYSAGQERDYNAYDNLYDANKPFVSDNIPLTERSDPWASRPSTESIANPRGYHDRSDSVASVSTVMGDRIQQPRNYERYDQGSYAPAQPADAYTEDPGPTPRMMDGYNDDYAGGPEYPARTQAHPAEGSLGRKTPRV